MEPKRATNTLREFAKFRFKREWPTLLIGGVASSFLASFFIYGGRSFLSIVKSYPLSFSGDGIFQLWFIKRIQEGWIFSNNRSGFPFGSNFMDYPDSDLGSNVIIKTLSFLFHQPAQIYNAFYFLGFFFTFLAGYWSARYFKLSPRFSIAFALVFDFLPFHFERIPHLYLTWYFVIPLYVVCAHSLLVNVSDKWGVTRVQNVLRDFLLALIMCSFGVYYTVFGLIVLAFSGFLILVETGLFANLKRYIYVSSLLILGSTINFLPNIIYQLSHGKNGEVAVRSAVESETYGFKFIQLLLPHSNYRIPYLNHLAITYDTSTPLVNENTTSSLGILGVFGLVILFMILVKIVLDKEVSKEQRVASLLSFFLISFGIIGGLGSLFAFLVTPEIRAWNRISVYIAFICILSFFVFLFGRLQRARVSQGLVLTILALVTCVGLIEETSSICSDCTKQVKNAYETSAGFIKQIESGLGTNASVYQLPYVGFPEVPPVYNLDPYATLEGYIFSSHLNWSAGGTKGRPGDLFYRSLAQQSIAQQLSVIKRLGFSGIYLDLSGYGDAGKSELQKWSALLGNPTPLLRSDGQAAFLKLPTTKHGSTLLRATPAEIMRAAGFYADSLGVRVPGNLQTGIDFRLRTLPIFVDSLIGFSQYEAWGRWTDSKNSKVAQIGINQGLEGKFVLHLTAQPFGPNQGRLLKVAIGPISEFLKLKPGINTYNLNFNLGSSSAKSITFTPPFPTSPSQLGESADSRQLGIGIITLSIQK